MSNRSFSSEHHQQAQGYNATPPVPANSTTINTTNGQKVAGFASSPLQTPTQHVVTTTTTNGLGPSQFSGHHQYAQQSVGGATQYNQTSSTQHFTTQQYPSTSYQTQPTTTYSTGVIGGQAYGGSVSVTGQRKFSEAAQTTIGHITGKTHTSEVVQHVQGEPVVKESRVVGHEKGVERLVSTTEHEMESVVHERIEHQRVKVPKKVVREEVIEKIYVVPETIQVEEWFEEEVEVEEKVVEVAKKIIIEKIVEVPEVEIIEKIIEVPETIVREKVREVAKIETIEKIVEVPVLQTVERCISVPQIEYRDVPIEKVVEVPEMHTEEVTKEVAIPQYVERAVEVKKYVESPFNLERKMPVPVEAEQVVEYSLPNIVPRYNKKKFPVYLPRFVEVPISRQFADAQMLASGEQFNSRVTSLTTVQPAMSLCEIETLATDIKNTNFVGKYNESMTTSTIRERFTRAWDAQDASIFGTATSASHNVSTTQTYSTYSNRNH